MDKGQFITAVMETPPDRWNTVLAAAKGAQKRKPIQPKQAAQMLGVCRRSLLRYEREGKLHRIQISTRKIRYDFNEVEALANGESIAG